MIFLFLFVGRAATKTSCGHESATKLYHHITTRKRAAAQDIALLQLCIGNAAIVFYFHLAFYFLYFASTADPHTASLRYCDAQLYCSIVDDLLFIQISNLISPIELYRMEQGLIRGGLLLDLIESMIDLIRDGLRRLPKGLLMIIFHGEVDALKQIPHSTHKGCRPATIHLPFQNVRGHEF